MKIIEIEVSDRLTNQNMKDTVDELCAKGIANGCFQDYGILYEVLHILTDVEDALKEQE